jgi:hypothetical protein
MRAQMLVVSKIGILLCTSIALMSIRKLVPPEHASVRQRPSDIAARCLTVDAFPLAFARGIPMLQGQVLPDFIMLTDSVLVVPWRLAVQTNRSRHPIKWSNAKWAQVVPDSVDIMIPTQAWSVGVQLRLPILGDVRTGRVWGIVDTRSSRHPSAVATTKKTQCPTKTPLGTFPP